MSILSYQSILRQVQLGQLRIDPFDQNHIGPAGYDVMIRENIHLEPGGKALASSIENFYVPITMRGVLHGRSSVARLFILTHFVSGPLEPGWGGDITFELKNLDDVPHDFLSGDRIAQVEFNWLDEPTARPYGGRYQGQTGITPSRFQHGDA